MTDHDDSEPRASGPGDAVGTGPFVLGIGASAGGLEALRSLLPGLPTGAGLVCVVAQHSAPEHHSMLPSLLASHTDLNIAEGEDNAELKPGTMYIVPPGSNGRIRDGRLVLESTEGTTGAHPSVDLLFSTIGDAFGDRCAGVVLSGTGSDGARGLRAIRAAGGAAFAQDPETAGFDGMPRAAIAEGCVDFVLAAEAIGPELARTIDGVGRATIKVEGESAALHALLEDIKTRTGRDFTVYKDAPLLRRIERRAVLQDCHRLADYANYVAQHQEEIDCLAQDILVSVTSFFRDPEAFTAMRKRVARILDRKRSGDRIRVWVPACATGEEAYSLAILFAEQLGDAFDNANLVVYGTDVDANAVEYARRGVYTEASLQNVDPEVVRRHFRSEDGGYVVRKGIRERMVFAQQDLLHDPPFAQLDLLACRNLLIYLRPESQADLLRMFHYAIRPGGLLFLGKSETIAKQEHLFEPVDKKHRIYRRKKGPAESYRVGARGRAFAPGPAGDTAETRSARLRDVVAHAVADFTGYPAVLIDGRRHVLYIRGDVSPYFTLREGEAGLEVSDLAVPKLRAALRSGVHRAGREGEPISKANVQIEGRDGAEHRVTLHFVPSPREAGREDCMLVIFEPAQESPPDEPTEPGSEAQDRRIRELETDLASTQENLQDAIEELETSNEELQSLNEELQSANEEMQSANEELETANEELQATNEELTTVNDELRAKTRELYDANTKLENILKCVATPLVVVDRDMVIEGFSRAAMEEFGLPTTCAGTRLGAIADHPVLHALLEDLRAVVRGAPATSREIRDEERQYLGEAHPFVEQDGGVAGGLLLIHDVTDARRREREFAALAENAPDVVARYDREARHLYVNAMVEHYTGRSREEWLGKSNEELGVHPPLSQAVRDAVEQAMATGETVHTSFSFPTEQGEAHFDARFVPEKDREGNVVSVMSVARDMTEQERATRAAATERARAEDLLRSVSDGFFSLDEDLVVTYFNDAAARLLGREKKSVVGRKLFDVFPAAAGSVFEERYTRALRDRVRDQFETYFAPYDEWYEVRVYPRDDGLSVYFQVITEQRRAEEQRARLEREFHHAQKMQALGTLSGGVAHEFNNILMAVMGFAEMVRSLDGVPEDAHEDLAEIISASERGRELVDQILAFSRKSHSKRRPTNVNEPVTRVSRILESTLARGITLNLQLAHDLREVEADPGQIEQVLLNLASNAQDAIDGPGILGIETRNETIDEAGKGPEELPAGRYVLLRVSDTGVGMDETTTERIFDPFFTTKSVGEGTGLGLSTVYGIVRGHGGIITCQSTPGEGTAFDVYLPVVDVRTEDEAAEAPDEAPAPAPGENELILVADDEASLRSYYERALHNGGYAALLASSGEHAMELYEESRGKIALVVLDLGMPGMGGLACLKQLRERDPELPVIIATGYAATEDAQSALSKGADLVLSKPFRRDDLLRHVREALDARAGE